MAKIINFSQFLCPLLALALLQVTNPLYSVEFSASSSSLAFSASSDVLYQLSYENSYSLVLWVKLEEVPTASTVVAQLTSPGQSLLQISQGTDGVWKASAGQIILSSSVYSVSVWTHVAVSMCSALSLLSLYVTQWQGITSLFTISASTSMDYDPILSSLQLGAGMIGQLLDCRIGTICLDMAEVTSIVSSASCHPQCQSGCFGPGDKACDDFIQLTDQVTPQLMTGNYLQWTRDDPHLQHRSFTSTSYSFTGWYHQTASSVSRSFFRSANIPGDSSTSGQRILGIFETEASVLTLAADLNSITNWYEKVELPSMLDYWMYVGVGMTPTTLNLCYFRLPSLSETCEIYARPGNALQWGTSAASTIAIGDVYYGGILGQIADQRYYFNSGLSTTALVDIFNLRRTQCGLGCNICASPFQCSTCGLGYYLDGFTQCQPCNSCCLSCSAAGGCDSCAPECPLSPIGVCLRCAPECATCDGRSHWNCLTCASGFVMQPQGSKLCLVTCPSGYLAVLGICQGSDQVIFSIQLDTITPTVKSVGDIEVLNGQTATYFPPSFEASDPRPSQHRGYYFSGAQYMQLPPGGSGPLMFPTSFTFTVWLRPQSGNCVLYWKDKVLLIGLDGALRLAVKVGNPPTAFLHDSALAIDIWTFLAFTIAFDSTTGASTMTVCLDGSQAGIILSHTTYTKDDSLTSAQFIGTKALFNFYTGFIWKVVICNYLSPIVSTDFAGPSQPSGLSFQLSPCPFLQTIDCESCQSGCSEGCVRTTDCSLCVGSLCQLCHDFTGCDQCTAQASGSPCSCNSGFFNTGTRACECTPECLTCGGTTSLVCLSCHPNAYLENGACLCLAAYFPDPHPDHCSTCPLNSHREDSNCLCDDGFGGSPPQCRPCQSHCMHCEASLCIRCYPDYFNLAGNCYLQCPEGYRVEENLCVYEPSWNEPLTAFLEVLYNQTLQLSFSSSLMNNLLSSDILLNGTAVDSSVLEFSWNMSTSEALRVYQLQISFAMNCTDAEVDLQFAANLTDTHLNPLETSFLEATVTLPCAPSAPVSTAMPPPTYDTALATTTKGVVVNNILTGMVSGSPASLFIVINNLQLLTYLPLSTIPMAQSLRNLLTSLNMQSFLQNPFLLWLGEDSGPEVPDYAASYGYDSGLFLANSGVAVLIGATMLIYWAAVRVLSRLPLGFLSKHVRKLSQGSPLLCYWLQAYLDITIAALLQAFCLSVASFSDILNSGLGLLTLTFCLITPFLILSVSLSPRLSKKLVWDALFNEFSWKTIQGSLFYSVFLFRRLLYALTLILAYNWPKLQALSFITSSLTVLFTQTLAYLLIYRPYKDWLQSTSVIVGEACMSIICLVLSVYSFIAQPGSVVAEIGKLTVYISLAFGNLFGCIGAIRAVLSILKRYSVEKETRIAPNSEFSQKK